MIGKFDLTMIRKFLKPGEFHMTSKSVILETLVGSCVCVCLYNIKNGWAAMNHFLRDRPIGDGAVDIGQFGSTSTRHIVDKLMAIDDVPSHYRAMVFGGAAVIKTVARDSDIGSRNIDAALQVLADARIPITKKEVSGKRGRRVIFDTEAGTVTWRFAGDVGGRVRGE
ncbi:MAG: chemotaxis protein CheD [Planctomycetota bacterium]